MANLEKIDAKNSCVNVGYETVVIDKLYGPTGFAPITIESNSAYCGWIVSCRGSEVCRVPGQIESDDAEPAPAPPTVTTVPLQATEEIRIVLYRTKSGFGDDYMLPEQADKLWRDLLDASRNF